MIAPTALITGASSGIGRHLAVHCAKTRGYKLALFGSNLKELQHTEALVNSVNNNINIPPENKPKLFQCDLSNKQELESAVVDCCENFGPLSLLINNAGIGTSGHILNSDLDVWDKMLDVNLRAVMHICYFCVPYMKDTSSNYITNINSNNSNNSDNSDNSDNNKWPASAIINIGSISGIDVGIGPNRSSYAATKYGLRGFSNCLFEDIREFGIKVSSLYPQFVDTPIIDKLERLKPLRKVEDQMIPCQDIAKTVDYILDCAHMTVPTEIVMRPQKDLTKYL